MSERKKIKSKNKSSLLLRLKKTAGPQTVDAAKFAKNVDKRTGALTALIMLFFIVLIVRVASIMIEKGDAYTMQVLSQQQYTSTEIPYKRGSILDCNGAVLAQSEKVYKLILDSKLVLEGEKKNGNMQSTLDLISKEFDLSKSDIENYINSNPTDQYKVIKKEVTYSEKTAYEELIKKTNAELRKAASTNAAGLEKNKLINESAVSFESYYRRVYPGGALAGDVLGYVSDAKGRYGLEGYYDDVLTGDNGREYGYLTDENALERTVMPSKDGYSLVTSIDSYIQKICENEIIQYNEEHANEFREGEPGSENTGVIIQNVHTGEIIAMASYPYYNPNNPKDLSMYTEETVSSMKARAMERYSVSEDAEVCDAVSAELWKNFCIQESYEPGSVCKTFTLATGLDTGVVTDHDIYDCGGSLTFGEGNNAVTIRCHNRLGDGPLTTKQALEKSCNVALMKMGQKIGKDDFLKYNKNFGFGLKTNIDLEGEMVTSSLVFNENTMGLTELMTSTFGQGYNVTMIETITAFSSLVNGGTLYKPHVVKKLVNSDGSVVKTIKPEAVRQVVSREVSDQMIEYCIGVVDEGTGTRAKPAGYRIGGKTGTAEYSGKGKVDYTVSFMGFAPADDPQIAIYVVIDRPNTASQENGTRYACLLCRDILNEVLPYMHIPKTEIISDEERAEQDIPDTASLIPSLSDNTVSEDEAVSGNDTPAEDTQNGTENDNAANDESLEEPLISGPVAVAGEENRDNENQDNETETENTEITEDTGNTETE